MGKGKHVTTVMRFLTAKRKRNRNIENFSIMATKLKVNFWKHFSFV